MNQSKDIFESIAADEAATVQKHFEDTLRLKIAEKLEDRKIALTQETFGQGDPGDEDEDDLPETDEGDDEVTDDEIAEILGEMGISEEDLDNMTEEELNDLFESILSEGE